MTISPNSTRDGSSRSVRSAWISLKQLGFQGAALHERRVIIGRLRPDAIHFVHGGGSSPGARRHEWPIGRARMMSSQRAIPPGPALRKWGAPSGTRQQGCVLETPAGWFQRTFGGRFERSMRLLLHARPPSRRGGFIITHTHTKVESFDRNPLTPAAACESPRNLLGPAPIGICPTGASALIGEAVTTQGSNAMFRPSPNRGSRRSCETPRALPLDMPASLHAGKEEGTGAQRRWDFRSRYFGDRCQCHARETPNTTHDLT